MRLSGSELTQVFLQHFGSFFSRISMRILAKFFASTIRESDDFDHLLDEFSSNSGEESGYCPFLGRVFSRKSRRKHSHPVRPDRQEWIMRLVAERAIYGLAFGQNTHPPRPESTVHFYDTWQVDKGPGRKRRIDSPRGCLRIVQESILEALLGPELKSLPDHIMCRPGKRAIDGAHAHANARFLAGMDVKDFYPSIRISHVIERLKSMPRPAHWAKSMPSMVQMHSNLRDLELPRGCMTSDMLDKLHAHLPFTCKYPTCCGGGSLFCWFNSWLHLPENRCLSHWEAVLIGRLITWRGRLPQGAPTSPAMANLAFGKFDERIISSLGPRFTYTRYMDDLSVSINARDAKVQMIDNPLAMRRQALGVVNGALRESGLRLNHAKTVVTEAGQPESGRVHTVTGYRVGACKVDLPRKVKRFFRGLGERIRRADFRLDLICSTLERVPAPAEKHAFSGKPIPAWNEAKSRHYFPSGGMSAEDRAMKMLVRLHPNLRWISKPAEIPFSAESSGGMSAKSKARNEFADLLSHLWRGKWTATQSGAIGIVILDRKGKPIGSLKADVLPTFFLLKKELAWRCLDFYWWFSGQVSRLAVPSQFRASGVAEGITSLWDEFRPMLGMLKFGAPT